MRWTDLMRTGCRKWIDGVDLTWKQILKRLRQEQKGDFVAVNDGMVMVIQKANGQIEAGTENQRSGKTAKQPSRPI
jgi:hypothetical protein